MNSDIFRLPGWQKCLCVCVQLGKKKLHHHTMGGGGIKKKGKKPENVQSKILKLDLFSEVTNSGTVNLSLSPLSLSFLICNIS